MNLKIGRIIVERKGEVYVKPFRELHLKLDELVALSDLNASYLSRLENGVCSSPSIFVLEFLTTAYSVDLSEFLNIIRDKKRQRIYLLCTN